MTPETRIAAAEVLRLHGHTAPTCFGGCDCKRCQAVRLQAVNELAPLLEGPLQREVEQMTRERDQALDNMQLYGESAIGYKRERDDARRENETLRQERDRAQADAMAEYWIDRDRLTASEAQLAAAREALPTPEQFAELQDVLNWAIREKAKQVEALHDADWARPPEFDLNERDEEFLASFTREGIEALAAIKVKLLDLAALSEGRPG